MPSRKIVAKELGGLLKVLSHPDRILLVGRIADGETYTVNQLAQAIGLAVPRVSQHLSLLRAFRVVEERREGRSKIYQLSDPALVDWLFDGIDFVADRLGVVNRETAEEARRLWQRQRDIASSTS